MEITAHGSRRHVAHGALDRSPPRLEPRPQHWRRTALLGSMRAYAPNAFGLQDMHGNVAEWCLDATDLISSYAPAAVTDPYEANGPYRVLRGGAWSGIPIYTRSAARAGNDPTVVNFNYGFRVVLAPQIP